MSSHIDVDRQTEERLGLCELSGAESCSQGMGCAGLSGGGGGSSDDSIAGLFSSV